MGLLKELRLDEVIRMGPDGISVLIIELKPGCLSWPREDREKVDIFKP